MNSECQSVLQGSAPGILAAVRHHSHAMVPVRGARPAKNTWARGEQPSSLTTEGLLHEEPDGGPRSSSGVFCCFTGDRTRKVKIVNRVTTIATS